MFVRRSKSLVRTGFFRSDPAPGTSTSPYFFIDPEYPLFATSNEFRYTDDPTMRKPVLERSNVGMGMLLTNSDQADLPFTNLLYRKLRDLEVNTLKRFTAVTCSDEKSPVGASSVREIILLNEAVRTGHRDIALEYLAKSFHNQADLALVVADYFKPLVTLFDGQDNGVALASLANTSACYTNSKMEFEFTKYGFVPSGGLAFTLAKTPWFVGELLALTGRRITGSNILYSGLAKRWISPEAFPFMEVTSEHKLETSERDAHALISEHFLTPPKDWVLKPYIPMINDVFSNENVGDMVKQLQRVVQGNDSKLSAFAKECLERMEAMPPLPLHLTNRLIKSARSRVTNVTNDIVAEQGQETANFIQTKPRLAQEHIYRPAMIASLKDEVRVAANLMGNADLSNSIHAYLTSTGWKSERALTEIASDEIDSHFEPLRSDLEYSYAERTDFPLSAHPKLRKFHPEFNPRTGLDHDPLFMQRELLRWSPEYLREERDAIRSAVTGLSVEQIRHSRNLKW